MTGIRKVLQMGPRVIFFEGTDSGKNVKQNLCTILKRMRKPFSKLILI